MLRIGLLVIALLTGSAAAWLAAHRGPAVTVSATQKTPDMEHVLVMAIDAPRGHKLAHEHMKWQVWPKDAVGAGFITQSSRPEAPQTLSGSVTLARMLLNEPINEAKLGGDTTGLLARALPSGRVAMAVRVSAETAAGGFILPSDRVDVMHTVEETTASNSRARHVSRAILRNVAVLAIDQAYEGAADEPAKLKPTVGKTATLELTREQAEILTSSQAVGSLTLALRSSRDYAEGEVASTHRTVRIIRSGQVESVRIPILSSDGRSDRLYQQEF